MPVPAPSSRRPVAPVAIGAAVLALALPAGASADAWAGGGASPRGTNRGTVSASVVTQGLTARIGIGAAGASCATGRIQRLTAQLPDPTAWSTISVGRTVTLSGGLRGKVRIAVNLARNAPDALAGSVRLVGNLRAGNRRITCRASYPVELRTATPSARTGAANDANRRGPTGESVSGGLPGAFQLYAVRPGRLTASWTSRTTCRTAGSRSSRTVVGLNAVAGLSIGPDGTIGRSVRRTTTTGGVRRTTTDEVRGTLGADGIVRGTVSARETISASGRSTTTCTAATTSFVAAP